LPARVIQRCEERSPITAMREKVREAETQRKLEAGLTA
jgi:hypothetical protein